MLRAIEYDFSDKPKVKSFVDSIGRNSIKSKKSYLSGLRHFENFIVQSYSSGQDQELQYNTETILEPLANYTINVYELLNSFVSYILGIRREISPKTTNLYVTAIRSYLAYYDIDVLPSKFKRKVKMPKFYREDEEPIDSSDIRKILLGCNNRRLKAALLFLASGGMRAAEGFAVRNMDIDFNTKPTKVHIRPEFSKTKVARDVYISDEATNYLKLWLEWKYKNNNPNLKREKNDQDLLFTFRNGGSVDSIYHKLYEEFSRLLASIKMDKRKESGIQKRKEITIHSLRRHAKTVVSQQVGTDYSEWFLGHAKSPYWGMKEEARAEIYQTNIMKYLTFLDYQTLETTGKNIEKQLLEKDKQIENLKEKDKVKDEQLDLLNQRIKKMEEQAKLYSLEHKSDKLDSGKRLLTLESTVNKLNKTLALLGTDKSKQVSLKEIVNNEDEI